MLYSRFPLAICFTQCSVYVSMLLSHFVHPPLLLVCPHVHSLLRRAVFWGKMILDKWQIRAGSSIYKWPIGNWRYEMGSVYISWTVLSCLLLLPLKGFFCKEEKDFDSWCSLVQKVKIYVFLSLKKPNVFQHNSFPKRFFMVTNPAWYDIIARERN